MKRTISTLLAVGAVTLAAAPAFAQPAWVSIDQRQAQLDRRIDVGVRNGSLTRQEAARLRGEFRDIERLEVRYRRDGLNMRERADLDRRFDLLSARIQYDRHDGQRADNRGPGSYRR